MEFSKNLVTDDTVLAKGSSRLKYFSESCLLTAESLECVPDSAVVSRRGTRGCGLTQRRSNQTVLLENICISIKYVPLLLRSIDR